MPRRFPRLATDRKATSIILYKVVEQLNKQYKKNRKKEFQLSMLKDSVFSLERPYASSGIPPVDAIVGNGKGFPSGIIEVYGPEATAKTALVENTIATAQRNSWFTILFGPEYSANYRRMKRVGIDEDNLLLLDAETIEDFYSQLKDTVQGIRKSDPDTPILVAWDSIAATPTLSEQENKKGLSGSDMGKMAQQMSKFFRRLVRFLFVNKICLICVNQTRTNLGQMYGNPEVTTGGKALRFYAWVRCRTSKIEPIKDSHDREIGQICRLDIKKNKVAPPFRSCKLHLYWDRGIDIPLSVWEYCIDNNIIKRKGTTYRYKDKIMTRKMFPKFYEANKQKIDAKIYASVTSS